MNRIESLECRRLFAAGIVDPTFGTLGTTTLPDSNPMILNRAYPAIDGGVFVVNLNSKGVDELVRLDRDGLLIPNFTQPQPRILSLDVKQDPTTGKVAILTSGETAA